MNKFLAAFATIIMAFALLATAQITSPLWTNTDLEVTRTLQFSQTYPAWIEQSDQVENLTVTNQGKLQLQVDETSGLYRSQVFRSEPLATINWKKLSYDTDLSGGDIELTIYVADTVSFTNSTNVTFQLSDGVDSRDLDVLEDARYGQIEMVFTREE